MTIHLIDSDMVFEFLNENRGSGLILSAMNLFMLGFLNEHKFLLAKSLFWCDGIMGVKYARCKGLELRQLRGVEMLRAIISVHKGKKISVLGSCTDSAVNSLMASDITIAEQYNLDNFKQDNFDLHSLSLSTEIVLITLPSPKQELLAVSLADLPEYKNVHFYCIGGALNMFSNPELDCPKFFQNMGLEFIFRLRTDSWRRFCRLIMSFIGTCRGLIFLRNLKIRVVKGTII